MALQAHWAITPDGLDALNIIRNQIIARSGSFSLEDIQVAMAQNDDLADAFHIIDAEDSAFVKKGTPLAGTSYVNTYDNGVAVINLFGPIYPRASMMGASTEGMSLEKLCRDIAMAYTNMDVKTLVLNSDSPGGDARGLGDAADFIYKLTQKGNKPFFAFASGYMCSAAYYLSAPAHKIIASKSGHVGSIGTVMTVRKSNPDGTLDIVSSISPMKRPDIQTDEGLAAAQQKVDDLGQQFAEDVRKYRGVSLDKVLSDYGKGDYMFGPRAKKQGLVDSIGTLASVVEEAAKLAQDKTGASYRRKPKATNDDEPIGSTLDVLHFSEEINMGLKNIVAKFVADVTAPAIDEKAQPATTANESGSEAAVAGSDVETPVGQSEPAVVVPTREELEDAFADNAELFASRLILGHNILPAMKAHAVSSVINAMIDDKLFGGTVSFVSEKGIVIEGTREESVKALFASLPKHTKTQEAIESIKAGTVTAVVLPPVDSEKEDKDGPTTPERRMELLKSSPQGRAVLAQAK